jgi:hypothetical protein
MHRSLKHEVRNFRSSGIEFEFFKNEKGDVTQVVLRQNGQSQSAGSNAGKNCGHTAS